MNRNALVLQKLIALISLSIPLFSAQSDPVSDHTILYDMFIREDNILPVVILTITFIIVMGVLSHYSRKKYDLKLKIALTEGEQATRFKEALLANISHEIRTPMNAIVGFTHLLLQSEVTDKQYETLFKIKSSSNMLLNIVNDILDFSKIEAGKIEIEHIDCNINSILEQVSDIASIKAKDKGISVIYDVAKGVPANFKGDPLRLTQVLINLLDNSVKFSDSGDVTLHIKPTEIADGSKKLQFVVADSGIGMKEEQTRNLFQAFVQADSSTSRKFGGTGLGLNISKGLVELMGGKIHVESVYGEGSRFIFTIALELANEQDLRSYRLPSKRLMDKNVLIVETNKKSIEALSNMLKYFHYRSSYASTSKELRDALDEDNFDMIIVSDDLIRLCLDGSILYQCKAKIVLMEEMFHREKKVEGLKIDAYLSKPFTQQMLFDVIVTIFDTEKKNRKSQKQKYQHEDMLVLRGSRILLADDNTMNQAVVEGLLEDTGIEVTKVLNGQKAVEEINKDGGYDLILMDINMPVMDGYKASSIIREYPQFDDVPIIALSANIKREDHQYAKQIGMQDYLNKPIDVEAFYKLLLQYIPAKIDISEIEPVIEKVENEDDKARLIRIMKSVDILEGLTRLNGNVKAYQKILFDFADSIEKAIPEFSRMIRNGKNIEAQDLAHYNKGIAGNLGAQSLHKLLKGLEDAFGANEPSAYSVLLTHFSKEAKNTLQQIKVLKQQSEKGEVPRALISEEVMKSLMTQLLTYAKKGKAVQCKELLEILKGYSWSGKKKILFDDVVVSVKAYAFKDTVHSIEAIQDLD